MSDAHSLVPSETINDCLITLRRLVAVEILLTIAVVVAGFAEVSFLPPLLREFRNQAYATFRITDLLLLVIALPMFVLMIVAWIALWRRWRSGRILYTIVWISCVPIILLAGPSASSAISNLLNSVATLVGGIVLGFLYFSDIRHLYERPNSESRGGGTPA
jgi:hypothetical protein